LVERPFVGADEYRQ